MGKFEKADNDMIDKLKLIFNKFICLHDWKLLHREVSESKVEQMRSLGATTNRVAYDLMVKTYIQIWSCSKCGKLKKFKDEI